MVQNKNTAISPADPNTVIQNVMDSIEVLQDIYVQETDALIASNANAFLSLQEQKFEAARTYQVGVEELLRHKTEMKDVPEKKKEKLKQMQQDFVELAEKNKEALSRMERCIDRVGDTIRRAAKEAADKQRNINYSEDGEITKNDYKSLSMGVNETA